MPDYLESLFWKFAGCLVEEGYVRWFYHKKIFYIDIDGYCYWHMTSEIEKIGEVGLINRAPLPNLSSKVKGGAPRQPGRQPSAQQEFKRLMEEARNDP